MRYVGDCIVLYDNTPEDSVRFLKAITDGVLPLGDFTDPGEVFETALQYQDLTVVAMLLDYLNVDRTTSSGQALSLQERMSLLHLGA